jgi:hypothetical protein
MNIYFYSFCTYHAHVLPQSMHLSYTHTHSLFLSLSHSICVSCVGIGMVPVYMRGTCMWKYVHVTRRITSMSSRRPRADVCAHGCMYMYV